MSLLAQQELRALYTAQAGARFVLVLRLCKTATSSGEMLPVLYFELLPLTNSSLFSDCSFCHCKLPFRLRSPSPMTAGPDRARWAAGTSTPRGWPRLSASCARPSPRTTCLRGAQQSDSPANERTGSWVLVSFFASTFLLPFCSFVSKMENRLQRRPRSTSMKDRQNSKAQSDRTSSMESECSPDSRLIAQVQQHPDAAVCTFVQRVWLHSGNEDQKGEIQEGHPMNYS